MSAKYAPTIDVAIVSYSSETMSYVDRSTGERREYPRRTLNWIAPGLGLVGSCPIPDRLAPLCEGLQPTRDYKPTHRLVLASFCYEHGNLKITLDSIESITNAKP